uniref:PIN domain-containing protein n=1 Tax=Candidatus Kentrum sp. TC TaxID=2126339 RepID=A0A450ZMW4_9GAMM|nr:MAG: hypothetical protein BECKTC1821F_GA0114240_100666 [Candidatus Kentron sp. TC]
MNDLPGKCLMDTNVPINANLARVPDGIPPELFDCVFACIEVVEHVTKKGVLVIDAGGEIFDEYRRKLSMKGQPGVGDAFMKWVHDHCCNPDRVERVAITKTDDAYDDFPDHEGLGGFDDSDRKFVAVANAHVEKPPILQATDSKWWGWKDVLGEVGITVRFLCTEYIAEKYARKMG